MFNRTYSFLVQNDILYKCKFGFRKGYSTSLALVEDQPTVSHMQRKFEKERQTATSRQKR